MPTFSVYDLKAAAECVLIKMVVDTKVKYPCDSLSPR